MDSAGERVGGRLLILVRVRLEEGRPGRKLGLVVLRGPTIVVISPMEGYEGMSPFAAPPWPVC